MEKFCRSTSPPKVPVCLFDTRPTLTIDTSIDTNIRGNIIHISRAEFSKSQLFITHYITAPRRTQFLFFPTLDSAPTLVIPLIMDKEITVQIHTNVAEASQILIDNGFKPVKTWVQTSSYWTHLDVSGSKKLPYKDLLGNSVITRTAEWGSEIIHKTKHIGSDGNVIGEDKITSSIDNFETTNQILMRAGLLNWITMTADQYIFRKDNMELCLQDVEDLGLFMEIEATRNDETIETLITCAKSLNLPLGDDFVGIKLPYMLYLDG